MINNNINEVKYIHGIYLKDKVKCKNIKETGKLWSLMLTSLFVSGASANYYTVPLEELKNKPEEIFKGLSNARSGLLIEAAVIRSGSGLVDNLTGKLMNEERRNNKVKIADAELLFEDFRRKLDPSLRIPSRLTCLFLAEDDSEFHGRLMVQDILEDKKKEPFVFNVKIVGEPWGFHRADYRWFNEYIKSKDAECIEKYWSGIAFDDTPCWEFLLEGVIELASQDEIIYLRNKGYFL